MKSLFNSPLGLLSLSVIAALILPALMMDGMFMDATMYSAVGHNMAQGEGSFWWPYYSANHFSVSPFHHENPPLGYWLFSLFFRLFGSSLYVERFYVLITFMLTAGLITRLWRHFLPQATTIAWLPLLLWGLIPTVFWSYTHNMMENTMAVFVLTAVLLAIKAMEAPRWWALWAASAGFALWCAFMVKGPPGLYPLAVPAIYWLFFRKATFGRMAIISLLMALISVGGIALLFAFPESGDSMSYYLFDRTLSRINEMPTVGSRFNVVLNFLEQIILPGFLLLIGIGLFRYRQQKMPALRLKLFGFFMLSGLCGILPLMLTRVQRPFYLVPAFPLIALALAVLLYKPVLNWQQRLMAKQRSQRLMKGIAAVLLLAVLLTTIGLAGKPKRSASTLADVYKVGELVGSGTSITTPKPISQNWGLKAYFVRYFRIQLEYAAFTEGKKPGEWVMIAKGEKLPFSGYQPVELNLNHYLLYRQRLTD